MGIGSLGSLGALQNNYYVPEIKKVNPDLTLVQELEAKQSEVEQQQSVVTNDEETLSQQSQCETPFKEIDLENFSLTFQKEDNFEYLGKDTSIGSLDVMKAVSDMKKDQVLEEYQYFVGATKDSFPSLQTEDGMVFRKEDL